MKYDVLFVHPQNYGNLQTYLKLPSLELCQISAVLNQNGYSNKLVDCFIDGRDIQELDNMLPIESPRIVLIYCSEYNHINALHTAYYLAQRYPNALIGILGMIVTFIPEYLLKRYPFIDFVLLGNADYVIKDILERDNKLSCCQDIKNVCYKCGGKIINNGMNYNYSLNDLPTSNRELYDLKKYHFHSPEAIVRSSRGCPSHCAFCNKTAYSPLMVESMKNFFSEIDILIKNGFNQFFFADDTFAFTYYRLLEFCDYYRNHNYSFRWTSNLRLNDITDELISTMKENGAYRVFIGIETLNHKSCELVDKTQNILDLESRIDILKKHKMEFHASLIVGNPGDTIEDLEHTSKFIRKIQPTLATFNTIKVYPGTPLYDNPDQYGILAEDMMWFENPDWNKRPMIYTKDLSPEQIAFYSRKMMVDMLI